PPLEPADAVEHVELGDAQARDAVDLDRALERGGVDPAAAPRAAGRRAELVPPRAQPLAGIPLELGRERAGSDAGRVGLGDPEDVVQRLRPDTGTRRGCA